MDATLRDLESRHNKGATTADDSVRVVVAYCRSQGYQYGGNIKSRVESLKIWRMSSSDLNRPACYAVEKFRNSCWSRYCDKLRSRRAAWILDKVKDRRTNIYIASEWLYLKWDGEKHIRVDSREYFANKSAWQEIALNIPSLGEFRNENEDRYAYDRIFHGIR